MSDKMKRVVRAFMQAFVASAALTLGNSRFDISTVTNTSADKALLWSLAAAGATAGISAAWNYLLDPSRIPSLAPAPVAPLPAVDATPAVADGVDSAKVVGG